MLVVVVATILQIARQPAVPAYDTIWAEDGQIFLTHALSEPFDLLEPYAGYTHLVPRAIAAFASSLPLTLAAPILSVGAAIVVALVALYIFFAARSLLPSPLARGTLAALMPLLPAAGFESLNNMANVQFFLLFACFWALVEKHRSSLRIVVDSAIVAVTVLTSALAILYLPLVLWRWRRNASSGQLAVTIAYSVGLTIQAAVVVGLVLGSDVSSGTGIVLWEGWQPLRLPGLFGTKVVAPLIVGYRLLGNSTGPGVLVLAWVGNALVAAVGVGLLRLRSPSRGPAIAALAYSLAFSAVPLLLRGLTTTEPTSEYPSLIGNRYVLLPMWFLLSAVLILVFQPARKGVVPRHIVQSCLVGLCVILAILEFSFVNPRAMGPRWSDELRRAQYRCVDLARRTVQVTITPRFDPGWYVSVPCYSVSALPTADTLRERFAPPTLASRASVRAGRAPAQI